MNAAMYLAGFALECRLKALLLEKLTFSRAMRVAVPEETEYRRLIFQSHDLSAMHGQLPDLMTKLEKKDREHQTNTLSLLRQVCGEWTIFARYSPASATRAEAKLFIERVEDLKNWIV